MTSDGLLVRKKGELNYIVSCHQDSLLTVLFRRNAGEEPKTTDDEDAPSTPVPPPISHIVSNARGPYPKLEMVSVPRSHFRSMSTNVDADTAAARRITRRLADVRRLNSADYSPFDEFCFRWASRKLLTQTFQSKSRNLLRLSNHCPKTVRTTS